MSEADKLDAVYAATTTAEIARTYDAWAATYDAEMAALGYRHPTVCLALLARHLPPTGPILDAGAGTGLLGEWLKIIGYASVEAIDLSPGMLAVAAAKGVYDRLLQADLTRRLPFEDARFAGCVCAGVFTTGHVGPEGLDELLRVVRPGGILVLTVKDKTWQSGFSARIEALAGEGRVAPLDATPPYSSMPGRPGNDPSRSLVLRRT
ncbi:class I SAM-dependent methyltransferase [Amaricoccus sp.]|uniref:class I SAM-dependent DNA methyltransferase n=1 Tax=Amaricoccus sp. TaxID=1872485 RepID=UPI00261EDF8F|nr:class I SAM-dependent methyltransferase [Amaricoccus sp.]HRO10850.1 class I SAM-dependent methyltransferase [Amaricoccus sp.]